jgi:hypothetical protein
VLNITKFTVITRCNIIKDKLIGNTGEIICTDHPIWCNNGKNRIFPFNIKGVISSQIFDTFYDIQFEEEGTFLVNGIMVDSLSPHNNVVKLPYSSYIDKTKYLENELVGEDDPIRHKPPMTTIATNFNYC